MNLIRVSLKIGESARIVWPNSYVITLGEHLDE